MWYGHDSPRPSLPKPAVDGDSKEVRQGYRQGWWTRSKFRWDVRLLTLDRTVGSRVWWHTQGLSELRARSWWGDGQENKWPADQTLWGQKFGKICQKRGSEAKNKSGPSKNRGLTMVENCVPFTSLIQQMKNSWRVESWKFRCQPQCLAEPDAKSTRKLVAFWIIVRRNTHASIRSYAFKNWENSRKYVHGSWSKERRQNSSFCVVMDICHLKNAQLDWNQNFKNTKDESALRGDIVRDDSGSYAVFTEPESSASQLTSAKVMYILARLPGCAGQAADSVSAYTQVKMEDAPSFWKIPESECQDIWIRPPKHKWPQKNHGPVWKTQSFLYYHGKDNSRKFHEKVGEQFQIVRFLMSKPR